MGEVIPFNKIKRTSVRYRITPKFQTMPAKLLACKAFAQGVYFDQETFESVESDHSLFLQPVDVIQVSCRDMKITQHWVPQSSFERQAEVGGWEHLLPRVLLEWVSGAATVPIGDYYISLGSNSRIRLSRREIGGVSLTLEPGAHLVKKPFDWLWLAP